MDLAVEVVLAITVSTAILEARGRLLPIREHRAVAELVEDGWLAALRLLRLDIPVVQDLVRLRPDRRPEARHALGGRRREPARKQADEILPPAKLQVRLHPAEHAVDVMAQCYRV